MKNLTKSLITFTLLGTFAYAVPTAKQKFEKADINNDGVLTQTEFYNDQARKMEIKVKEGKALKGATTAPQFTAVDKNNNGKVTFKEYDRFHTKRQKEMINIRNNSNGMGAGKGKGLSAFKRFDRNNDGCIDKNEFREVYQALRSKQGKGQGKGQGYGYNR